MRIPSLACAVLLVLGASAQGITTSVQDGDWGDPSTWDCNCVPEVVNAVVMHQVRIATNTFLMQNVHITAVGSLVMDEYFSVVIMDTVINDGLMDLVADFDVDWALFNNGTIRIAGVIHNDGLLVMGGPDALLTTDDIGNYDTIEGEGRICVSGFSENTGTIHGLIDFCDLTPTVGSPPFIDVNTGTVAGSVTYCASEPCGPQHLQARQASSLRIGPNPADDQLLIDLPSRATLVMRDASGRVVLSLDAARTLVLDASALPVGLYSITVASEARQEVRRVAIAR
ncbi:MAG TPA: T9SS type A sorting domain-containing protein [Flavobacteriales bacterium]|nr:T9SS type A sorting domain-containing protein [Flavobacteriales bacterium]